MNELLQWIAVGVAIILAWLKVRGPMGPVGPMGPSGIPGPPG